MTLNEIYSIYLQHPVVTTDTRQCEAGSIFFALKGASFDGNKFAAQALEAGCAYAVVDEQQYAVEGDARYILVGDVLSTLQALAALHRRRLTIPVLQITGTNGKTTTKELVSAVLARKYRVLYTQGNLNNHIGVPRTLLRIRPEHEIAVVETGANHPGEIDFLCRMVQADYGLITNVGRAHLEGFGSFDGVKATKGELYDDLARRRKTIFLNALDDNLLGMAQSRGFEPEPLADFLYLGYELDAELPVKQQAVAYAEGQVEDCTSFLKVRWREHDGAEWHSIQTHLVGAYNIANIRAAITVGRFFDVEADDIDKAIADYQPTNSRSEFRDTGRNHLIVDAYNANPTSMGAALDNFQFVEADRKMVVLGMMGELGADSKAEHQAIVDRLKEATQSDGKDKHIGQVWLVGSAFAEVVTENWLASNPTWRVFPSVEEVKTELGAQPVEGYTILIKGSNSQKLFQLPELL